MQKGRWRYWTHRICGNASSNVHISFDFRWLISTWLLFEPLQEWRRSLLNEPSCLHKLAESNCHQMMQRSVIASLISIHATNAIERPMSLLPKKTNLTFNGRQIFNQLLVHLALLCAHVFRSDATFGLCTVRLLSWDPLVKGLHIIYSRLADL